MTWFEIGFRMFAAALPVGLLVMFAAPVTFMHALGAMIVGAGLIGMWVSALGLRLEHPERWHAIKRSVSRMAAAGSPSRSVANER